MCNVHRRPGVSVYYGRKMSIKKFWNYPTPSKFCRCMRNITLNFEFTRLTCDLRDFNVKNYVTVSECLVVATCCWVRMLLFPYLHLVPNAYTLQRFYVLWWPMHQSAAKAKAKTKIEECDESNNKSGSWKTISSTLFLNKLPIKTNRSRKSPMKLKM